MYVDATAVRLLTNEIEGHRLLNEELKGLEDEVLLSEDPWYAQRPHVEVAKQLVGSERVAADNSHPALAARLSKLRIVLSDYEMDSFRSLGADCGEVIGEVARAVRPGVSEWEVAGELSGKLLARGITPVVLLVAADERADAIRHPLPTQKRVKNKLMLVLCGRRHGLVLSATRMVYLTTTSGESIPADLLRRHDAATYVDAVAMVKSSAPGTKASDVLKAIQAAYAEKGFADEWKYHHQGGCAAFVSREWVANPEMHDRVTEKNQAYAWNPTVAGTKSEDTILVRDAGDGTTAVEVISVTPDWPVVEHTIDGVTIARPAILHLTF